MADGKVKRRSLMSIWCVLYMCLASGRAWEVCMTDLFWGEIKDQFPGSATSDELARCNGDNPQWPLPKGMDAIRVTADHHPVLVSRTTIPGEHLEVQQVEFDKRSGRGGQQLGDPIGTFVTADSKSTISDPGYHCTVLEVLCLGTSSDVDPYQVRMTAVSTPESERQDYHFVTIPLDVLCNRTTSIEDIIFHRTETSLGLCMRQGYLPDPMTSSSMTDKVDPVATAVTAVSSVPRNTSSPAGSGQAGSPRPAGACLTVIVAVLCILKPVLLRLGFACF